MDLGGLQIFINHLRHNIADLQLLADAVNSEGMAWPVMGGHNIAAPLQGARLNESRSIRGNMGRKYRWVGPSRLVAAPFSVSEPRSIPGSKGVTQRVDPVFFLQHPLQLL